MIGRTSWNAHNAGGKCYRFKPTVGTPGLLRNCRYLITISKSQRIVDLVDGLNRDVTSKSVSSRITDIRRASRVLWFLVNSLNYSVEFCDDQCREHVT